MQELEKILEEIIEQLKAEGCIIDDAAGNRAEEIVRQHMNDNSICADCSRRKWYQKGYEDGKNSNDGWIPVEDRLPEADKVVIVTTDVELITFGYIHDGEWVIDVEPDYPIAWWPLPEPYHPERSDNNDGE